MSWLQVFRSANTASLGHRGDQERKTGGVPSEKYVARRGSVEDEMRLIIGCFSACTPEMYEPHIHAFSPRVSRSYTDQQNSQPVPRLVVLDASLFSFPLCRPLCAALHTQQDQGPLTSRSQARRPPLAPCVPQKTVGSLPCPPVCRAQIGWLPLGSSFSLAHGRGVAQLHKPVAGHVSWVETGTHQVLWL